MYRTAPLVLSFRSVKFKWSDSALCAPALECASTAAIAIVHSSCTSSCLSTRTDAHLAPQSSCPASPPLSPARSPCLYPTQLHTGTLDPIRPSALPLPPHANANVHHSYSYPRPHMPTRMPRRRRRSLEALAIVTNFGKDDTICGWPSYTSSSSTSHTSPSTHPTHALTEVPVNVDEVPVRPVRTRSLRVPSPGTSRPWVKTAPSAFTTRTLRIPFPCPPCVSRVRSDPAQHRHRVRAVSHRHHSSYYVLHAAYAGCIHARFAQFHPTRFSTSPLHRQALTL
ncbi:hypothetical protein DFH08DRAFT_967880 [Mycena albidolilacea]|uniref:Uncharacterized protein n=1 Tax=Mycena albidolilacea TaxID=1033008 RepID=A0AAD6ZKT9_9AGAR|nr:hypothetical protein DFH08DRAFT_967880 [Mycena albidolilacea]